MRDFRITTNELAVYLMIANIVLGILFGSFPLLLGLKLKNRKYAIYGFISSIIGSFILGVFLSYPIAIIFTWLLLKNSKEVVEEVNEMPLESEIISSDNL